MSDDRIRQYILAASEDQAIADVGVYDDPCQVYCIGATVGVALVLADWTESDRIKDANMQNLRARDLKAYKIAGNTYFDADEAQAKIEQLKARYLSALNLMGAAVIDRNRAVEVLKEARTWLADGEHSDDAEFYPDYAEPAYIRLIQDVDSTIKAGDADLAHNAEFEHIQTAAKRYETLRRLNARQFADLYAESIKSGVAFDDLVDGLVRVTDSEGGL